MSSEISIQAVVINPDRTHDVVTIPRKTEERTLQTFVGGYIEAVYGWTYIASKPEAGHTDPDQAADVAFFCNEEGKIHNMPENEVATALWWLLNPDARGIDYLRGVVVVTGGANGNGDTVSVPSQVVRMVEQAGA